MLLFLIIILELGPASEQYLVMMGLPNLDWNDAQGPLAGCIVESSSVPEPGTMLLIGLGLVGLAGVRRKFQK